AETIEGGHGVPDKIAIAQAASLLDVHGDAEFSARLLPDGRETVGARISWPGTAFAQDLQLDVAGEAIDGAAHLARPGEREQGRFGLRVHFRMERAEF